MSFEDQLALATALFEAVDARNEFTDSFGGFDSFAEMGQHVGDNRKIHDELQNKFADLRKEFDTKIPNKSVLVEQLKAAGKNKVAERIEKMFSL